MTGAHRLPGVLMRRCRGARAVASFTKPDATQAAKRSATASPSSFREAATPNDDPAVRLGDGMGQPAFVAHLATRGCDKEARVAPAIRGANFNAAERHGATNQIQRIPVIGEKYGRLTVVRLAEQWVWLPCAERAAA